MDAGYVGAALIVGITFAFALVGITISTWQDAQRLRRKDLEKLRRQEELRNGTFDFVYLGDNALTWKDV